MRSVIHLRDSPFVGGPEKQILGQCARLDRSRIEPMIVSFDARGSLALTRAARQLGIRTESLPDGKLAFPNAVRQLRRIVTASGECVVVSSGFKADLTAWLACSRESVPWIVWFHGHTAATARVRVYEALDTIAAHRASTVIAVCEASARHLRESGLRNVVVVPNAIDASLIASDGSRETARGELGLGEEELVVGTAARLSVEKGIGHLIDAAPAVLAKHPTARFVIIGDGPLRGDLERRAQAQGVSDRCMFTGFRVDAVGLIKAFDVFVLPSLRENMPVALLEAMACGVSVVATDVGGVREVLEPAGIEPITPGSAQAITRAVGELLADPGRRAQCASAAANRAGEFSFERQVALVQDSVLRVAGAQVSGRASRT